MDSGAATLLGALVGGLATYGGVLYTQHHQTKQARERERRADAAKARIAARILQGELAWAEARCTQALKNGRYWSSRYAPSEDSWQEYREIIAGALESADTWSDVRDGFRAIRVVELQASKRREDELSRAAVSDWGRRQLELSLGRIERAIEVLQPVARDRPRESTRQDPDRPEAEASWDDDRAANTDSPLDIHEA